nr:hypothetical protein CFP56_01878 [Quercus suber]
MLTPQNPYPPAVVATMDHRHCIDFSLPLHRRSIQCWHIILRLLAAHFFFVLCHRLLLQSLMFINATTKVSQKSLTRQQNSFFALGIPFPTHS